jgi:uncharacterized protein YndB with AHSA1/START domain
MMQPIGCDPRYFVTPESATDELRKARPSTSHPQGRTAKERSVSEAVERMIDLPRAPEEVWAAITTPAHLAAWFGAHADVEPRPGGAVRFRWADGTERRGVVEVAEPPRRFAFRWRPVVRLPDGVSIGDVSHVEFRLEPSNDGGTRLTVTESAGIVAADALARTAERVDLGMPTTPRWQASG